ncbi:MAG: FAD-dependent oxidoreductase [Burkholderiaceae bacterium]|nr:FAD-dependent oxidoreductase [Burkholderiaceae bacterium]
MSKNERFDVVVVGAGAVGTSAAYLLARQGLSVCVVERKEIGRGSSGHGHGAVNLIGKAFVPGPHFMLGVAGGEYYPEYVAGVMEHSGIDPMFHEIPAIAYAINEEEEAILRKSFEYQRQHSPMEWASVQTCREIEPRLTEDAIGGVIYRHGQVNGLLLSQASGKALEKLGGKIIYSHVVGLQRSGSRVTGVQLTDRVIEAGHVVLAMGAWSSEADRWVGFPVPVRPGHGEVLHYRIPGAPVRAQINTALHGPIFPARDGTLLVGSIGGPPMLGKKVDAMTWDAKDTSEPVFDEAPTQEGRDLMIKLALRLMPSLAEGQIIEHRAGVRPLSFDQLPIIGPVPDQQGLYLSTGHGFKGLHLAPISARLIVDHIKGAQTVQGVDADAFLPQRFL